MSVIFDSAAREWAQMRRDYQDVVEAEYAAALAATNGYMVNRAGVERGWTTWRVFTGPPNVVAAYGTDELRDHLAAHPRLTLARFEQQWLDDRYQEAS